MSKEAGHTGLGLGLRLRVGSPSLPEAGVWEAGAFGCPWPSRCPLLPPQHPALSLGLTEPPAVAPCLHQPSPAAASPRVSWGRLRLGSSGSLPTGLLQTIPDSEPQMSLL